jgi:polar amino acid transport system permease protein
VSAVLSWAPQLMAGLLLTLEMTVVAIGLSSAVGFCGGLGLLYGPLPLRAVLRVCVDCVRGLPVLVLIFAVYYLPGVAAMSIDAPTAATIALGIFGGAHLSEVVRGGIGSLPRLQLEAAKAIGLTSGQRLQLIVLPLAIPRMVPPWVNTGVEVLKGTSLASLIGAADLLYIAQSGVGTTFDPLPFYMCAAAIYFSFCFALSRFGTALEDRYRYREY